MHLQSAERPIHIHQPGPPRAERVLMVEASGEALRLELAAGLLLRDAVYQALAKAGYAGGTVDLAGVSLWPFGYVMPALSKTGENAAFYSDIFRPAGISTVRSGAMTFGERDNAPFFHAHALWYEADGVLHGGHLLPEETFIAATCTLEAFGLRGATFVAQLDPETNFKLLSPLPRPGGSGTTRALALRLCPNQDFHAALENICTAQGIRHARIRGGVGSLIGVMFDDGRETMNFATEIYITHGEIIAGIDGIVADISVGMVDYTGAMAEGRLARGKNPVLMTFELVLEVMA